MYVQGDLVVYGNMGVCTVVDIRQPQMTEGDRLYYVLEPVYIQGGTVYTPVDGGKVPMRHILSKDGANQLIDQMPAVEAFPSGDRRAFQAKCREAVQSASLEDLMRLTKSLYMKKELRQQKRGDLSYGERETMVWAEQMLYGELASALEIPLDQVEAYIDTKLG